jgi:hypothetical protein
MIIEWNALRYFVLTVPFNAAIHLLAASMANGPLSSMTALRAAAAGGREAIIDESGPFAENLRHQMNGEI